MYFFIVILIIGLDQYSKYLVVNYLKPKGTLPLIQDVFHLTYAENTGAAFSILSNKVTFLSTVTSIFIIGLIVYLVYISKAHPGFNLTGLSLAFIVGGAIGNLIDRIRLGFVVDFFDFRLINFAIFNIADTFIVIGSILMVVLTLLNKEKF